MESSFFFLINSDTLIVWKNDDSMQWDVSIFITLKKGIIDDSWVRRQFLV